MQSFVCGTRLCFGADAPAALAGLHAERVLLVTDPYFAENGTAARYAAAFPGAQVEQFSDVAPDPPLSLVAPPGPGWPGGRSMPAASSAGAAAPPSTAPRASPRSAACPSAL